MFGEYHDRPEAQGDVEERMQKLHQFLGVEDGEVAMKTQRRTDDRRDATGRRISKPHALGKSAPEPSRKRDHQGYRVQKPNDLGRYGR